MRLNKHFDSVLFQKSQNPLKKLLLFVSYTVSDILPLSFLSSNHFTYGLSNWKAQTWKRETKVGRILFLFQQFKAVCSARKRKGSSHWLEKQPLGGGSKDSVQHDCLCNSMQT